MWGATVGVWGATGDGVWRGHGGGHRGAIGRLGGTGVCMGGPWGGLWGCLGGSVCVWGVTGHPSGGCVFLGGGSQRVRVCLGGGHKWGLCASRGRHRVGHGVSRWVCVCLGGHKVGGGRSCVNLRGSQGIWGGLRVSGGDPSGVCVCLGDHRESRRGLCESGAAGGGLYVSGVARRGPGGGLGVAGGGSPHRGLVQEEVAELQQLLPALLGAHPPQHLHVQ